MEDPDQSKPTYLFGSKGAGIACGVVAAFIWWGIAYAAAASSPHNPVPAMLVVGLVFVIQLVTLGFGFRGASAFIATQIITAILLPILVVGLIFGYCMLGGFHM